MRHLLWLACIVLFSAMKCSKDIPGIVINGFLLTDAQGNNMGQVGNASDDWQLWDKLSDTEMALFNFGTDDLENTVETVVRPVMAFPNPVGTVQYLQAGANDIVLVKMVIVDSDLKVLKQISFRNTSYSAVAVNLADRTIFMNKASLRVYYSYSAKGKPNFKVGYGDIKICDDALGDYMKCF